MKNLKNTFAAGIMMAVMVFGTTFANAGIIIARDANGAVKSDDTKVTSTSTCGDTQAEFVGIIIALTGIIIAGKGGIIIAKDSTVTNCGIIIA